jgi:hypothetical protein
MIDEKEELSAEKLLSLVAMIPVAESPRDLYERVIVQWRAMRAKRLELERQAKAAQETETAFKSYAIEVCRAQKLEGVLIDGRITGLNTRNVATVSDKEKLIEFMRETGDISLLQFRLATGTVDEYKATGVSVPGVEYIDVYDLSDKKV